MGIPLNLSVVIFFLLGTLSANSQTYDSLARSWDKILISDSYGGWHHFNNNFELRRINDELILTNRNDSILNRISQNTLKVFFKSLTNDKEISKDPLKIFNKDSTWLINNAAKLWFSYLGEKNEPAAVDTFAIKIIKDYNQVKKLIWRMQGSHWTDDYPLTEVSIIKGKDTLFIQSFGQYPYMMPWFVNGKTIYNAGISTSLSEILPSNIESNKLRLGGDTFNYHLIDIIYDSLIHNYRDYMEASIKYSRQFYTLNQHYKISNVKLAFLSSIEWGGSFAAPCLELTLNSKHLPDNISFSVLYGRRLKLHSVTPIIRKEAKIIHQLTSSRVYQYTVSNENTRGEIHFVNTKSLNGQAKRNFLSDVKERGIKKSLYRGRLRQAIFYELTEDRDNSRSFSRWIFLKDGTNILWEIKGDYLMNLDPDIIKEKGYVCRVIVDKELQ